MTDLKNMTDEELLILRDVMRRSLPPSGSSAPDFEDIGRSAGIGLAKGAVGIAGAPGDAQNLITAGVDWAAEKAGVDPKRLKPSRESPYAGRFGVLPGAQEITREIEQHTGKFYKPKTALGHFAEKIGEFAPGAALGPGGIGRRVATQVLAPAIASESAGRIPGVKGTAAQPYAELAAALTAPMAANKAVNVARPFVNPAVPGASRQASGLIEHSLQSDPQGMAALPGLGPDAMLADAGPAMRGLAQGVVAKPTPGGVELARALEARNDGRSTRLLSDVNANLGPARPPSAIRQEIDQGMEILGPRQDAAIQQARAVDTQQIANQLDTLAVNLRGPERDAVNRVRGWLNIPGTQVLDPHPGALLNVRRAIDGVMTGEINPSVQRQLTMARQAVDAELARVSPGLKNADAGIEQLALQREGLERGATVLDTGKTAMWPSELAEAMTTGAQPNGTLVGPSAAPFRLRQGVRADIENKVGTNVNDLAVLKRTLGGEHDWNRAKLAALYGDAPVDRTVGAINREQTFARTHDDVLRNSQTAPRVEASRMIDGSEPGRIPVETGLTGLALRGAQKLYHTLAKGSAARSSESVRNELGRILSMNDPQFRQQTLQAVQQANTQRLADQAAQSLANRMRGVPAAESSFGDR